MRQKSWKGRCNSNTRSLNRPGRGRSRRRKREQALASAPGCRSSATSNAMVQRRSSAESKASCTSDLVIGDGAQIEGSVIAQDVTVCGRVKGTIRAVRVKLQDGGVVEGDIFHRSLSIDENSVFEGSSRRVENPTDAPSVDAKGPRDEDVRSSALAPYLQRVEPSASTKWSDSTVEPKH